MKKIKKLFRVLQCWWKGCFPRRAGRIKAIKIYYRNGVKISHFQHYLGEIRRWFRSTKLSRPGKIISSGNSICGGKNDTEKLLIQVEGKLYKVHKIRAEATISKKEFETPMFVKGQVARRLSAEIARVIMEIASVRAWFDKTEITVYADVLIGAEEVADSAEM